MAAELAVVDSDPTKPCCCAAEAISHQSSGMSERGGVFDKFKFTQHWVSFQDEENLGCRTVYLWTSISKMDDEQSGLRFCFRIISPLKAYTLQAENGAHHKDWVDKIRGVTTSLLNSPFHEQAVESRDIKRTYELLMTSDYDSNMTYDDLGVGDTYRSCDLQDRMKNISIDKPHDPQDCYSIESGNTASCLQGKHGR